MKDDLKSCIPAILVILLLYALAGTADYAAQSEIEEAKAGAAP
jgi:hypothetical protein